jgi:hypothetical protein
MMKPDPVPKTDVCEHAPGRFLNAGKFQGLRYEPAAGLPEALGRLLLAKAEHIDALFSDATCEAREVAVGRYKAEALKSSPVQEVHSIDHESYVGPVLTGRIGELLLRDDRMLCENVGPRLQACA